MAPPDVSAARVYPQVAPPPPLDTKQKAVVENWKLWRQSWSNYLIITGLDKETDEYKVALLLHSIGPDSLKIYNGMKFSSDDDNKKT